MMNRGVVSKCALYRFQHKPSAAAPISLSQKKLFDVLAEELFLEKSRGDRIRTCDLVAPNDALYQAELHPEV